MATPSCAWAHYSELPLWSTSDIPRQLVQPPKRPYGRPHAPDLAARIARLEERVSTL
jgi:hypothetical protein